MYFYCSKLDYIAQFCYKTKQKNDTKNAKDDDDSIYVMRNETHSKSICKWIMDSEATKHMTLHWATFNTYKVIAPCHVHLGDDNIVEAIRMGCIVWNQS